ncbi:MAG: GNAT family N-acetyltransferase [Candidatus Roizmanbacteria bacterium]|nr:GNAT family N-acetyltransferase [Candidatus Roizmanbacteria bacterium]
MNIEQKDIQYVVVDQTHFGLLAQASALIGSYAEKGLMLEQTEEALARMSQEGSLVVALLSENGNRHVVGSIAITTQWPDGKRELGAWAVHEELRRHGIGIQLLEALAVHLSGTREGLQQVIAFANNNSGPIFESLGATPLPHAKMHPDAFVPCQSCHCDKVCLAPGQMCVDTIFNLSPVMQELSEGYNK